MRKKPYGVPNWIKHLLESKRRSTDGLVRFNLKLVRGGATSDCWRWGIAVDTSNVVTTQFASPSSCEKRIYAMSDEIDPSCDIFTKMLALEAMYFMGANL